MNLNLHGKTLISYDFGHTINFRFTGDYALDIETDISLRTSAGIHRLVPGINPGPNSKVLDTLPNQTVTSSVAEESGALVLTFLDGTRLGVGPDDNFEAWTFAGPGGQKVVCMPGGELAVWSASDDGTGFAEEDVRRPRYFVLEPESSPTWGEHTELDHRTSPPSVTRLHIEFTEWLGDDLLWVHPTYIVTERLAERIANSGLGRYEFRSVEVTADPAVAEDGETLELPGFVWFHVTGEAGRDDFGVTARGKLVVSQAGLDVLCQGTLNDCDITLYRPRA